MSRRRPRAGSPPAVATLPAAAPARARRRRLLWLSAALLAAALAGGAALRAWRARPQPVRREAGLNVLLVTIDTLRADALGVYGQQRPTSPWIDRLARAGVRFETAYAHNVVTLPSHANILSGRYPSAHGVRDNAGFRVPADLPTLATWLSAAGYETAAFVSGFPLDSRFGLEHGFHVYDDAFADDTQAAFRLPERAAAESVARAAAWLDARGGVTGVPAHGAARPFFCWLHLYDPHAPYLPPPEQAAAFSGAPYLGEVAAVDAALGRLLRPLLEAGPSGRTLVVLTADHGESLGEHGERTHGLFAYEATLRVPLLFFAPRLWAPRVVATAARHVDLAPSVLDALALPLPAGLDGRSLLEPAAGQRAPAVPSYFEALSAMLGRGWAPLYGVVHERRKYIDLPLPELYDLGADPHEQRNVVAAQAAPREALSLLLRSLRAGERALRRDAESADTRQRLAALGYVTAAHAPVKQRYTREDDPKRLVHLDDLMQRVLAHHRRGELAAALELCAELVAQRPDMAAGWLQMALLLRRDGRTPEAVTALERALGQNPEDLAVAVLLGAYLAEAGRAREAVELLAPYAQRPDAALDVLTTHGAALARLGRTHEALASFERAARLDPSSALTRVQLATVLLGAGRLDAAGAALAEATRLAPELALAHHHLGLLAGLRGDNAGAERAFRRALELDPQDADSRLNLGWLLRRTGRTGEAREHLQRFLESAPAAVYAQQLVLVRAWLDSQR